MTRLVVAVLVAALTIAVSSAAQIGSGKIAFVTQDGLYTVNPDGTGRTLLQGPAFGLSSARWSPDGSRIAFLDFHAVEDWRLMVMNSDGSNEHLVAAAASIALSRQPWSPDGSRIAWGPFPLSGGDVYTADAAGGDVRRLTFDGLTRSPPSWSPTGSTLVYSKRTPDLSEAPLFVIGRDGSGERRITPESGFDEDPTWSPNGEWIAFIGVGGVALVRPDGSDLHAVAFGGSGCRCYSPTWSPDGSTIAFGVIREIPRHEYRADVYVVDASGSHLRRLNPSDRLAWTPVWSPDGDRILFRSIGLMTMNADGTCQMNLASGGQNGPALDISSWQPIPNGPPIGRAHCHAIAATAMLADQTPAAVVIGTAVVNEGTEPVTKVTLDVPTPAGVSAAIAASRGEVCTVRNGNAKCRLSRLDPGDTHLFSIRFEARRVKTTGQEVKFRANIRADASEELLLSGREETYVTFALSRCTDRDRGGGTIRGTPSADRICGRRGSDRISPGRGSDVVKAGDGNDVIFAGDGTRYRDQIACGRGNDRVRADRRDRVARDCERVTRR
jgi:Tol biopolymer transport system component